LSVSQLTKEFQCVATFFPDFCILQDFSSGQVKGIGREDQGLYILKDGLELKGGLDCIASAHSSGSSSLTVGSVDSILYGIED